MHSKNKAAHLHQGKAAEQKACEYLTQQGLKLITKNFNSRYGELDLIMEDQKHLVIIEVRYRKTNKYGSAEESITLSKQSRIIATTQYYLQQNKTNRPVRFDVVTLTGDNTINWIPNAFYS